MQIGRERGGQTRELATTLRAGRQPYVRGQERIECTQLARTKLALKRAHVDSRQAANRAKPLLCSRDVDDQHTVESRLIIERREQSGAVLDARNAEAKRCIRTQPERSDGCTRRQCHSRLDHPLPQ